TGCRLRLVDRCARAHVRPLRLVRAVQEAASRIGLASLSLIAVPPLQDPQCPQGVPAAGRAEWFQRGVGLPLVVVLQRPAAILAPGALDDVNRLGEARVAGRAHGLEVIERAKDIVVPAGWEGEANEDWLDDFAGAMRAEEPVHEEKLAAAALRGPHGAD